MAQRDGAGIRLLTRNGNVEPEGEISPEQDELGQPTGFRCSRARFVSRVQIPAQARNVDEESSQGNAEDRRRRTLTARKCKALLRSRRD
jgi:hypothetical protein